ncbi:hypothetical protein CMV30_14480 [Nibricoccus aquaticus]|uniref:Uncharacterized protein n=1 Tax=Nibricoccus aquaticus TaxID=2576891 RepID=A0A290Q8U1_9BACT|nr:hypothetical protein [Nibricoccus aquaticus]ATC65069.1 hypothetical protein CMV30_14480 [Nibricoccus aquaticus]
MRYPAAPAPTSTSTRRVPSVTTVIALLALTFFATFPTAPARAKSSEWQDLAGTKFKGEPVEVLGPFALFKTSLTTGRRMMLRGLAPDDILRLHHEISARPARAATWANAKSPATSDLLGRVFTVENQKLVPADLSRLPEPELLLVLFGSHNDGESWEMLRTFTATYERIQRVYPGKVGCVFMGVRHSESEHRRIATTTSMPWFVADLPAQNGMNVLNRFTPAEGTQMVLLSRHGVPLLGARASSLGEIKKFADELSAFLAAIDPANPRSWPDRSHYLSLTRPLDFASKSTGPLLLGDPLRADGLRQRGITRIDARLAIDEQGRVTDVTLLPTSVLPEPMKTPLADALRKQAVFLPALDQSTPVASSYDYSFVVPPENKSIAADTSWLNGDARTEIPLPTWLILEPIKVEEKNFSDIDHVAADDTVMLKALSVSTAKVSRASQMNAFNTDWFTEAGADTVRPTEGDPQPIDGATLTWKRDAAPDGLVDFGEHDYSVGYAWTEFDSPADTDAWLGLGSDDGVKIWLNGHLVSDRWIRRMSRLDDDVVPLRLKKGKNRLLIKIQNATGGWSFITRLRTR